MKEMTGKKIVIVVFSLLFSAVVVHSIHASEAQVTKYGLWKEKIQETDGTLNCYFGGDLWGTNIQSAIVTSPINKDYVWQYNLEEEQWDFSGGAWQCGKEFEDEFPNGTYTILVTYTDGSTETLIVDYGGTFAPIPVFSSLDSEKFCWEPWDYQYDQDYIEVEITSEDGKEAGGWLPWSATCYFFPAGFFEYNTEYSISIYFLTKHNDHAFHNSELDLVISPPDHTLNLDLTYDNTGLTMNFEIGTKQPAFWNVLISSHKKTKSLLSIPIPVVDPPISFPIILPRFQSLGNIGVLTTLTTKETGIICSDWETVDTGPITAAKQSINTLNLRKLFKEKLGQAMSTSR